MGAAEYTDCMSSDGQVFPNEYPAYDTKQSDSAASVMLELWGMRSTPLLPSSPDQLWLGVVPPNRVLSMGQIEINRVITLK